MWRPKCCTGRLNKNIRIKFTFMHLADTFIQSDLRCIQVTLFFYIWPALAFPGNRTHDLGVASAMLYHLSYRKACIKLHCLPLRYRIHYKVLLHVFKALHGLAPEYISDLISLHQSNRSLHSNDQLQSNLKCNGDRAFSVAAPRLWNDLPLSVKSSPTLLEFQSALKTHLFSLAFQNVS